MQWGHLSNFVSGTGYIPAFWEVSYADTNGAVASDDYAFILYFNDELIFNAGINSSYCRSDTQSVTNSIPPFTKVTISAQNQTSTTGASLLCYIDWQGLWCRMTLSAGTGFNAVGREIFGFSNQIVF